MSRLSLPLKLVSDHKYIPVPPDMSVVEGGDYLMKQIAAGKMHEDLTPRFSDTAHAVPLSYRSVFGPVFPVVDCHLPGSGTEEFRTMVGRMIALRAPDKPGYSEDLALKQTRSMRRLRPQIGLFKRHLELHIDRESYEQSYPKWLYQPHAKKKLRLRTAEEVYNMGGDDCDDQKYVEFKCKNGELLAAHKKRGIGDLGAFRTNATAHVMDSIKDAWSKPYVCCNATLTYVKSADKESLRAVFKDLLEPMFGKITFVYHSDDSCVGAYCKDGRVCFNGDIKACDGSHRTAMFNTLEHLLSVTAGVSNVHRDALARAFSYLRKDLVVPFPKDRKQKVRYKFRTMRLYSGSTLTTLINNFANWLIGVELSILVPDASKVTKEEFKNAYRTAGENVGYILKIVDCDCPEQLQFLKHSPTYVGCEIEPWMNLGTYTRGFGTFDGDLAHGKGGYKDAARLFVSDVVKGRRNWGNHVFNDAFSHLMVSGTSTNARIIRRVEELTEKSIGEVSARVPVEALAARYKCATTEIEELCHWIGKSNIGDVVWLPLVSHIYNMDYG